MNILADEQNGFKCNHSCEDHVCSLTAIVQNRLHHGKDTFVAFIEFTKAFDSVDRNLLLCKLLDYNINENIYFAIKKLYSETQNCMRVNSMYSRWSSKVDLTLSPKLSQSLRIWCFVKSTK